MIGAAIKHAAILSAAFASAAIACGHAPERPAARRSDVAAIEGRLLDWNTGLWLAGASVAVHCTCLVPSRSTRTDAGGRYVFTALPAGRYSIEMRHLDGVRHEVVDLASGQHLDFGSHSLDPTGTPSPVRISAAVRPRLAAGQMWRWPIVASAPDLAGSPAADQNRMPRP